MKSYSADAIRNVVLLSHGGVGKTSLAEAMCFTAKTTSKQGKVDNGTSVFDARSDEKERKMTTSMTPGYAEWHDVKINMLDVPGFLDLIGDTIAALRVVESALILVDASAGIEVGTEIAYRYVNEYGMPRVFFVNGMDKENVDFTKTLEEMKQAFGTSVAPLVIPIGSGSGFRGVVDLVTKEAFEYARDGNGIGKKSAIPDDMTGMVETARASLMESVAESDEELLNKFLEAGELSDDELRRGLAKGVAEGLVYPLLSGSAVLNMGVDQLLWKLSNLCPAASRRSEHEAFEGETTVKVGGAESDPPSAFVFKTLTEEHLGEVTIVRAMSGKLSVGMDLQNTRRGGSERLGQLYAMVGHERREIESLRAGDIGALVKLKDTHTGDSLVDKSVKYHFAPVAFPEPLVSIAVTPKSKGDEEKISAGFVKLHEEDPTFTYGFQPDIHQSILSAMGDVHIELILNQLRNRFKVEVDRQPPKISYRETITKPVKYVDYTHKKQTGGAGQYGRVAIDMEPAERGGGYEFIDKIVGGVIDQPLRPSVDKGIQSKMKEGILAGYPIVDVKVTLVDGKTHPVDSKDIAFQIAGREAFKKAFESAGPILLEPIDEVKVTVPDEYTGDVMGDLSGRRGRISGMEPQGGFQIINAKVPESEIQNYSQALRSITQGRGVYSRSFSHYEPMPPDQTKKVIEASQREHAENA